MVATTFAQNRASSQLPTKSLLTPLKQSWVSCVGRYSSTSSLRVMLSLGAFQRIDIFSEAIK